MRRKLAYEDAQLSGCFRCRLEAYFSLQSVVQERLGIGQGKALLERPLRAWFLLQFCECVFDMFAGAKVVDAEIGTGAVVVACGTPANGEFVGFSRGRVGERELRKIGCSPLFRRMNFCCSPNCFLRARCQSSSESSHLVCEYERLSV